MKPFRAMILAAGMGTRLRPLTLSRPKVLAPVQNRSLLQWLVEYLRLAGAEAVIVNAHHLSQVLVGYVEREDFDIPVLVRVEETLLDTGGGIRNVSDFWDERAFVVINGDILSSIDLQEVLITHERSGASATLVLKDEPLFNRVQVASDGSILGFSGGSGQQLAFAGIHVLDPQVLTAIPADTPISIIDCYLELISAGGKVMAHVAKEQFWRELGSLDGYLRVHQEFFRMESVPLPGLQGSGKQVIHESARLGSGVRLDGMVCIGAGCILDDEVVIQNSVIWDRVRVRAGYSVRGCIIGDGVEVGESLKGEVVSAKGRVKLTAGS
ncbi:MAG: NDP-sugar synthase [Deltaproteobacteria bacterium]|nr:MAG: NDP-sugar synthase [Deltaproteobacteria bacterium]